MFKAIVFDLDGTLVDSPLCFKTIRLQLGIPEGAYILEYLERIPPLDRSEKLKQLERIELEAAKKAVPFPHVLDLLARLDQQNIKVGVFTRNCRSATQSVMDVFGIKPHRVITREDALPKPHPEGLLMFLEHWDLRPDELLFVGDFKFDIECGKSAGVRTALFTNGREIVEDWSADYTFPSYALFMERLSL